MFQKPQNLINCLNKRRIRGGEKHHEVKGHREDQEGFLSKVEETEQDVTKHLHQLRTTLRLCKTLVVFIILYGCKPWTLHAEKECMPLDTSLFEYVAASPT
ncbi:hypothetical protein DPMN_148049 [Dreissena polymorpha]|uniref:Uncharacterized protein n=1 Tax=Dreissena polymorpha TaxID=45954 RepID=A0A9D4F916_DREPO|nr:hypothetical protein DPMN_148049 [Dreissena polymorpha]